MSGAGSSWPMTANAFCRLVPPVGAVRAQRPRARSRSAPRRCAQPAARRALDHRPRCGVERVDLELGRTRQARSHPLHGVDCLAPLARCDAPLRRHVAQAQDVHERLVEHARRGVHQHQHAPAVDLERHQLLTVERRGNRLGRRRIAQPAGAFLELLEVRLQPLEAFAPGQRVVLVAREFLLRRAQLFQHLARGSRRSIGAVIGGIERIAQLRKVLVAVQHFLLEPLANPRKDRCSP